MTTIPTPFNMPKLRPADPLDEHDDPLDAFDDDVLRASMDDTSEVRQVTVEKMRRIGQKGRTKGLRQGRRDLAAQLGFATVDQLVDFIERHRAEVGR